MTMAKATAGRKAVKAAKGKAKAAPKAKGGRKAAAASKARSSAS